MHKDVEHLTFRDLDGNIPLPIPSSMLENWYISVRDIKVAELGIGDLARACRQNEFVEEVVPYCLKELKRDPLAGVLYLGELAKALTQIPTEYWTSHTIEKDTFLALAKHGYEESENKYLNISEADLLPK